jgi:ribosomal protein S6
MKDYELTVLIHPDLESDLEKPLAKIRSLVTANGGEIAKEDNWGKKKLAYAIKGEEFAIYVAMDIKLPATAPLKISNTLNITDEVLRYLLVKAEARPEVEAEEEKQ